MRYEVNRVLAKIQQQYTCDYCGAEPGERCFTAGGLPTQFEHNSRYVQAVADGKLPIDLDEVYG